MNYSHQIQTYLSNLYGKDVAEGVWVRLQDILTRFKSRQTDQTEHLPEPTNPLTENDLILITYGDQFHEPGRHPLQSLRFFLEKYLAGVISAVHILPFYPYTSDDGFSVTDYKAVNPALGTWEDIACLGNSFQLMFDAVLNHISRESAWFQGYLAGEEPYLDYFHTVDPAEDLSRVVRPRALPLLTPVQTVMGERHVWTTFSDDQIDLNYSNPEVLLELIGTLLLYLGNGARFIRLDAIAYLWKEIGTPCIHLPQTHQVVKLIRAIFDFAAPGSVIITETNVPHEDNISYFGEPDPETGHYDEAQMVYQFPLAPLALHTFQTGDARPLATWAASLETPGKFTTFFNFIASHDGIGINPARGLLTEEQIQALVDRTLAHGGRVSYKANADGSQSVYELNITLFDALNDPRAPEPDLEIPRFVASQALMLSLAGVPGIYIHSLLGSHNCLSCYEITKRARSLNREKFERLEIESRLADPGTRTARVFAAYLKLLRIRRQEPAFHPQAAQTVLPTDGMIFSLLRRSQDKEETILSLINVTPDSQMIRLDLSPNDLPTNSTWRDIISTQLVHTRRDFLELELSPYQVVWLKPVFPPKGGENPQK